MSIDRILAAAAAQPWALMPEKLAEIRAFLELRSEGVRFTAAEIEARVGPGRTGESGVTGPGAVAVIPIIGIMTQRANMLDAISGPGGTSTEMVGAQLRRAIANPDVKSILLEIDSPGGSTYGVQELADEVHRARDRKTVVAQVNSLAASAAYWVASAASEVVMTPGGDVGSIGVYGTHSDMSGAMEKAGIRKTFISAGKYKTEGHPFEPLTDEARDYAQRRVNEAYETFVGSVARGRGTTSAQVKAEFGQGRTVGAREAVRLGMVDRIGTMQDTFRRLSTAAPVGSPSRALAPAGMLAADALAASGRDELRRRRHRLRTL
ncbi:hypothetical protein ASG52_19845 [Methylobacterium sp. Leaf456]|uniref:signal peptide peptidase SppA n=1 Tax=Methylobacterium sp. Leaf456 TaxID=1736382 RepID=UPI0006F212E8|nr:signal peptide peptidase SppA [Methylobacterium sp. Leaf456]KQT59981.1 hypothetical protein ASG52_19845 [Methylobacterium sp. Leaf456]